ncbi:MAG: hypothetical protein RIQ56_858 [Candidatus Parcubacteria bacterium]
MTLYLAQGTFVPSVSAKKGVEMQMKILNASEHVDVNDAYALLQEFGSVLAVDISDLLNRSSNRQEALDAYVNGLKNIAERSQKKMEDITQSLTIMKEKQKTLRAEFQKIERVQRDALRNKDYTLAAENQPKLDEAQRALQAAEQEQKQAQDVLVTFKELVTLASKRLDAIEKNREILLAGLKVTEVPGIEDLGIILDQSKKNRTPNALGL